MRRRVIPLLASMNARRKDDGLCCQTEARGFAVFTSPSLNKGTAFTPQERKELGLARLLVPDTTALGMRFKSAFARYERLPDALSRSIYLTALLPVRAAGH